MLVHLTDSERRAILDRDKWHCTAMIRTRLDDKLRRCPVVGSEMVVVDGRTLCPRCARKQEAS